MATPLKYSKSFTANDEQHKRGSRPHSRTLPDSAKLSTSTVNLASPGTLIEGLLYKRQRGRKAHDLRGLKFQQRYCVLTHNGSLAYYPTKKDHDLGHKPSGTYQIAKIKIVEKVPDKTFKKPCCFQIGNEKEVMYFYTTSESERDKWIETLRIAAFDLRKNQPLPYYHEGAFGQHDKNQWSCCNKISREATGCVLNTTQAAENRTERQGSSPPDIEGVRVTVTSPAPHPVLGYSISLPATSTPSGLDSGDSGSDRDSEYGEEEPESIPSPTPAPWRQSGLSLAPSEDSGKGSMYDFAYNSPGGVRRGSGGIHRMKRDLTNSSLAISEVSEDLQPSNCPLVYKCKTTIASEEIDSSHTTTLLYKGVDSLITASSSGEISSILKVNTPKPQKQILFPVREKDISISVWDKHIALGSSSIQLGNLDGMRKLKTGHSEEDLQNLVAFTPHGTLCTAIKGGNLLCTWPKPTEWSMKATTRPACRLKVGGDGDQIFSLTVSPHPERPFVAVGITSGKDTGSDFVHVYNYETKEVKHSVEMGPQSGLCAAFTHDGQHLFVGSDVRLQCYNTTYWSPDKFYYCFRQGGVSISSLCCSPVRHHLAVGLTTGEVIVFIGDPNKSTPAPYSITEKSRRSAVTSLSYSRDGMKTAVAYLDGTVQIWKGSKPPEERPLVRTGTLEVTSKGLTHHSEEDGYTIKIPEGAVKEGSCVQLHYGVVPDSPFGPYVFNGKERAHIVSPIVSVCPEPLNTVFLKPIEITLLHCVQCVTPEHCNRLYFYKTRHNNFENENSTKIYQFEKVMDGTVSHFSQFLSYGERKVPQGAATLYTTHCCDFCIAEYYDEDRLNTLMDNAPLKYSLHQIVPKNPDALQMFEVLYCLSYFLSTCVQRVEEQYPADHYDKEEWPVSFLPSDSANRDKKLTINFDTTILDGGWRLQARKIEIAEQDVCFWDFPLWYIKDKCQKKEYPPKLSLQVQRGAPVPTGVKTKVSFSGVERFHFGKQPEFTLELVKPSLPPVEVPHTPHNGVYPGNQEHVSTDYPVKQHHPSYSSTSSFQSAASSKSAASIVINEPFAEALEKFQDDFDEIANNVPCQKLASALFSCSSRRKCPYLADDKPAVDMTKSFLEKARAAPQNENFPANFQILSDAYSIAERHPQYILTIKEALVKALPTSVKEQLGYASPSHRRIRSTSNSGYATPDEAPPMSPVTPQYISNGFAHNGTNGLHPQTQKFFNQVNDDPNVS